ncbi:MAG TPA: ABC transporter permease [Acidobacteria bacterium]|nr:ABC transporter permease [Acidobacteriota bacterium]
MDDLKQDLRFAVRMLAKNPWLTAVAVLCIALGIGTNVTAFSVVSALMLRPFPYADPETLTYVDMVNLPNDIDSSGLSYPDLQDLRAESRSFSQVEAYGIRSLVVQVGDEPERVSGAAISAGMFPLIGEKPALGRLFRPDEDAPGAPPVVLLSHALWTRRFNGDPRVVGTDVMINAKAHTVVGVMKPQFGFPERQEAWVPLAPLAAGELRDDRGYEVMARIAPGVSTEAAEQEVAAFAKRLAAQFPDSNAGWGARLRTLSEDVLGDEGRIMVATIQGAVIFVLLIACANVANLFLARATARQREMAVRLAFGAGRWRLARQLLTESLLVAFAGGALGMVFGHWGIRWMESAIPQENMPPPWMRFEIDGPVVVYTVAATVLTGILFGLAPAFQAVQKDLQGTLKEGGRGAGGSVRRNRLRNGLVIAEIALALTLLMVTALFLRSFFKLQTGDAGFDTAPLLTLRVYLPGARYEEEPPKTRRVEDLLRRIEALPGIEAVGASNLIPMGGGNNGGNLLLQGRPVARGEEPRVSWAGVSPHFFKALGLGLVRGRGLTEREALERAPVALVNQAFVKRFFPEGEVLGQRFRISEEKAMGWMTIVGVVPDFHHGDLSSRIRPAAYLPLAYLSGRSTGLTIRTRLDPAAVTSQVREAVRASDPELPVYLVSTMEQLRQDSFWEYRLMGGMFSVFGGIALFLAAIGVYGVLSYSVSQRVREIGVRMALGSQREDVLWLVVRQGLTLALTGIGIGLVLALGAGQVVASVIYEVSPRDPVSFLSIALLLTAVAAFASFLPANRATEVDPLEALRNE